MGHSWSMDTPHAGGLDEEAERELVQRSLSRLRELTGQPVRGWLSPGKFNSPNTPDLIAAEGIEYFCDWVNDELPYKWNVASGDLWSMPLATEISDTYTLVDNLHSEESWADQVCDAAAPEAREGLQNWIRATFGPAWAKLGWTPARSESEDERLRRASLLRIHGLLGEDPAIAAEVGKRLSTYLADRRSLEPNLAEPLIAIAARDGDLERFDRLRAAVA